MNYKPSTNIKKLLHNIFKKETGFMFTRVDSNDYNQLVKGYNDAKKEIISLRDIIKAKDIEIEKLSKENEKNLKEIEKLKKEASENDR